MLTRLLFTALTLALFFSQGCSGDENDETQNESNYIPVKTIQVQQRTVNRTLHLLGDVRARQQVRLFSTIPERIRELHADLGDTVERNELIARIENSNIRSRVSQMEANLEQAGSQMENLENEFARMKKLLSENAVSQQQFDATKTQLQSMEAQVRSLREGLNQAQTQLADSYIRAPFAGVIGQRFLEEGDLASMQSPVVTVVQMDTVKVLVNVVEKYVGDLRRGLRTRIDVASYPDTIFTGYVDKISPVVNPRSRMVACEIIVPNRGYLLRPGMFVQVRIILESHANAVVVPKYAILQKTELEVTATGEQKIRREDHAYVVRNDTAYYTMVLTGVEEDNMIEILSGLSPGQDVVILGQNNLEDSTRVKVIQHGETL